MHFGRKYYFVAFTLLFLICSNTTLFAQTPATYPIDSATFGAPMRATHYDLDGDGDEDIVVQRTYTNLGWFRNEGGVINDSIHYIAVPSNIDDIAFADMDNDADPDIIVHSYGTDYLAWIENVNGDASLFELHIIMEDVYEFGPGDAQVSDIDGDGDIDIGVILNADFIGWYENDGAADPSFTLHTISTPTDVPSVLRIADFDGDGDDDMIAYTFYDGDFFLYQNYGGGTFPTMGAYRGTIPSIQDVAVGDIDVDGDVDLVFSGGNYLAGNETITIYANMGTGAFYAPVEIYSTRDVLSVEIADFNGDLLPDIFAQSDYGGPTGTTFPMNDMVFLNAGGGSFDTEIYALEVAAPDYYLSEVLVSTAPDIDGDGLADVWGSTAETHYYETSTGNPDELFDGFVAPERILSSYGLATAYHSDLSGDMKIVTFDDDRRLVQYRFDDATQTVVFEKRIDSIGYRQYYSSVDKLLSFDMENDGDADLFLSTTSESSNLHFYRQIEGNTFDPAINVGIDDMNCLGARVADMNGDGYDDIVAADYISVFVGYDDEGYDIYEAWYKTYWCENLTGAGDFIIHNINDDYYPYQEFPSVADFDLDGDVDVFIYNTSTDEIIQYSNVDGLGNFDAGTSFYENPNVRYFDFFDENNDGAPDLIYNTYDSLNVRLNNGSGDLDYVRKRSASPLPTSTERFVFTDVNLDGYMDLICGSSPKKLFVNVPGFGLYTTGYSIFNSYTLYKLVDVNGDSIPEILGKNGTSKMYAQEITQPDNFMLVSFSNDSVTLDEDGTMADTISVAMFNIPQETCYFTYYQQAAPIPVDFELDCGGGAGDSTVLTFLPDSTALIPQAFIIKAADDEENDDLEKGKFMYFSSSETGLLAPALTNTIFYTIIDNDGITLDEGTVEVINGMYDIQEGGFGTALSITLLSPPENPVTVTVDPDEQLDFGLGAGVPFTYTSSLGTPVTLYVDAQDDTLIEGPHTGTYTVNFESADDNYDSVVPQVITLNIADNDWNEGLPNASNEAISFNSFYTPEDNAIRFQYQLQSEICSIHVYNVTGIPMAEISNLYGDGEGMIDVEHWPSGMYLIEIVSQTDGNNLVNTVVVY